MLATIQDASHKGYDTVLLNDSSATNNLNFARQTVEFNCQRSWGFRTPSSSPHSNLHEWTSRGPESTKKYGEKLIKVSQNMKIGECAAEVVLQRLSLWTRAKLHIFIK